MPQYWIKVTRDDNAEICSLYSPDFGIELLEDENMESINGPEGFRIHARDLLLSRLERLNHVLIPKTYEQLRNDSITSLQHWECFDINLKQKNRFFSKFLPGTGHLFNVYQIISGAFITFMALRLASNNSQNSQNSTALSILGSAFNSIVIFFVYVMSDASNILTNLGHRIDNLRKKNSSSPQISARVACNSQFAKFSALTLTAGGCMLANVTIASVRQYQEVILLANKYLELYPELSPSERDNYLELIKWLVINGNIIATSYCVLAFQSSFASELIKKIVNRSNRRAILTNSQQSSSVVELEESTSDSPLVSRLKRASDVLKQRQLDPTLAPLLATSTYRESEDSPGNTLLIQMPAINDSSVRPSEESDLQPLRLNTSDSREKKMAKLT